MGNWGDKEQLEFPTLQYYNLKTTTQREKHENPIPGPATLFDPYGSNNVAGF
jgi:hypothetical protein